MEIVKELFGFKPRYTTEENTIRKYVELVSASNWLGIQQQGREDNLTAGELWHFTALGACYAYAANIEPTRDAKWTALKTTIETLGFPEWSEAITIRHQRENS